MKVLTPYFSCVCNEEEFEAVNRETPLPEIYVVTQSGKILKHMNLTGGRHIRIPVDSIPNYKADSSLDSEINFLPAGKVPVSMFRQIEAFFRKVMEVKGGKALEAMAHILWNPQTGYRIAIPNQTISAASVTYDFQSHMTPGDIIVVDIH
jgi:hypothetical protein